MNFKGNILFFGAGCIAQCTLPILLKHIDIPLNRITMIDFVDNRDRLRTFIDQGLNYEILRIDPENYEHILQKHLKAGDLLIDLAWELGTASIIVWCQQNNVLYVNTSLEVWNSADENLKKNPIHLTLYHRQMELRKALGRWPTAPSPTAILDHGANPGLVSHFTKKALIDIAQKILQEKPFDDRVASLERALSNNDFPLLAYLVGLKTIHISERDTQITNVPKRVDEFVNTWSVEGLIQEGIAPAELGWGTHERYLPEGAFSPYEGPKNQIFLAQKGVKTWVRSWVPSGPIIGMVIRHGEAFSISDYLTVYQDEIPVYRPTVHYAYCPSDGAINSLVELEMKSFKPQKNQRILNVEITEGKDELGCLLMGHDFKSWWIGSVLDIATARRFLPSESATSIQVAIGVVAASLYAIRHPLEGVCQPDQLDYQEILDIALPYLGEFLSIPCDWSPLDDAREYADFNGKIPDPEDVWQFPSFLVSGSRYGACDAEMLIN